MGDGSREAGLVPRGIHSIPIVEIDEAVREELSTRLHFLDSGVEPPPPVIDV